MSVCSDSRVFSFEFQNWKRNELREDFVHKPKRKQKQTQFFTSQSKNTQISCNSDYNGQIEVAKGTNALRLACAYASPANVRKRGLFVKRWPLLLMYEHRKKT